MVALGGLGGDCSSAVCLGGVGRAVLVNGRHRAVAIFNNAVAVTVGVGVGEFGGGGLGGGLAVSLEEVEHFFISFNLVFVFLI